MNTLTTVDNSSKRTYQVYNDNNILSKRYGDKNIPTKTSQLINDSGYITEEYVNNKFLPISGGQLQGKLILDTATPTEDNEAVSKKYVDNLVISSGNLPAHTDEDKGKILMITSEGTVSWCTITNINGG